MARGGGIFLLIVVALVANAVAQEVDYGYCTPYPGDSSSLCYDYVTAYSDNVFFYTNHSVTRDEQQQYYLGNVSQLSILLNSANASCRPLLAPFLCVNLFAPCITKSNQGVTVVVRQPVCKSYCTPVHTQCDYLLNSPLVKYELSSYADAQPFLTCASTDPNVDNLETFPDTGYVLSGVSIPCGPTTPPFFPATTPTVNNVPTPATVNNVPTPAATNTNTPTPAAATTTGTTSTASNTPTGSTTAATPTDVSTGSTPTATPTDTGSLTTSTTVAPTTTVAGGTPTTAVTADAGIAGLAFVVASVGLGAVALFV